jgi:hypothetical protein
LYALSPDNGTKLAAISVLDIKGKQLVQHNKLSDIGIGSTAIEIAMLA